MFCVKKKKKADSVLEPNIYLTFPGGEKLYFWTSWAPMRRLHTYLLIHYEPPQNLLNANLIGFLILCCFLKAPCHSHDKFQISWPSTESIIIWSVFSTSILSTSPHAKMPTEPATAHHAIVSQHKLGQLHPWFRATWSSSLPFSRRKPSLDDLTPSWVHPVSTCLLHIPVIPMPGTVLKIE